jgi:hypothetical protein
MSYPLILADGSAQTRHNLKLVTGEVLVAQASYACSAGFRV